MPPLQKSVAALAGEEAPHTSNTIVKALTAALTHLAITHR
jgi:hypothetical protein